MLKHLKHYAITVLEPERYAVERANTLGQYHADKDGFIVPVGVEKVFVPRAGVNVVQMLPT